MPKYKKTHINPNTMETKSVKVFSGLAIDVNTVKKHLESKGINCYAENRNAGDNGNGWAETGFDPYVELFTTEDQAIKAKELVDELLNTKAE